MSVKCSTRWNSGQLEKTMIGRNVTFIFAYIGDKVFVPIEKLDMSLLNRVAQQVPLYDIPHVKPKRVRKQKSVTSNEETMTGDKERKMVEENRRQVNRNAK